ncbi:MAG: HNH endonuclease [Rhodospirillaceae bacterium]|nr:HNH endonuclease [Rhodospirillaceae bacterium]MBL6941724.1 HNH endonuclease [Rhodospirillales bacterium]
MRQQQKNHQITKPRNGIVLRPDCHTRFIVRTNDERIYQ